MSIPLSDPESLNQRRRMAVRLRTQGQSLREVRMATGLSAPTIIHACKAYSAAGWEAVDVKQRGRDQGDGRILDADTEQDILRALSGQFPEQAGAGPTLWSQEAVAWLLERRLQRPLALRTVARYLSRWGWLFPDPHATQAQACAEWTATRYPAVLKQAKAQGGEVFWAGKWSPPQYPELQLLFARSKRGTVYWLPQGPAPGDQGWTEFASRLQGMRKTKLLILLPADQSLPANSHRIEWMGVPGPQAATRIPEPVSHARLRLPGSSAPLSHLERLEAESIQIMREVLAEAENPVMLYSIGKDSSVMLHLAQKAFWPARIPFPLLHIDTGWKFREMYRFRDQRIKEVGARLLVYTNPEGLVRNISPLVHGSAVHTDVMKTQALRLALDQYGFDVAFGGARRDEEKSRAKERVFSFRSRDHRWDPKNQRPELWKLYNAQKQPGESLRVFPLSNWTELDIWLYIRQENIPVVPLYFAAERPVVERDGMLIMLDDERLTLRPGECAMRKLVRFRTLGCYPLTAAIESSACTLEDVILEMLQATTSERQGRLIDSDSAGSMEKKKQEGYF